MPAVAGDSMPVGKVPIFNRVLRPRVGTASPRRPAKALRRTGGPAAGDGAPDLVAVGRVQEENVGPSSTYISMRATASSMPWVGRQSVRARIRIPNSPPPRPPRGTSCAPPRAAGRAAGRCQRPRSDLVLDQDGGGSGAAIGAHRALTFIALPCPWSPSARTRAGRRRAPC